MKAAELLTFLRTQGLTVLPRGGKLHIEGPPRALTPAVLATARAHKAELLRLLADADPGRPLSLDEAMLVVARCFAPVEADRDAGAALDLIEADRDLHARLRETERAADAVILAGSTEADIRRAVQAHVAVLAEACQRVRARREAAQEAEAAMPDLPEGTTVAVGLRFADGTGEWLRVHRARGG